MTAHEALGANTTPISRNYNLRDEAHWKQNLGNKRGTPSRSALCYLKLTPVG